MNRKISLETFIFENPVSSSSKKKSKLMPFKTEIAELKKRGYTLDKIVEYLRLNDLIVGRSTVVFFIKNHIEVKQGILQKKTKNKKVLTEKITIELDQEQDFKSTDRTTESKPSVCNWQTPITKEDLF